MKLLADEMPGQPDVRMQLALYYLLNNQPREAIEEYTRGDRAGRRDISCALRSRGDAYLNVGDHAAAVDDFDSALKLEPEDSALLNNFAWVLATSPDDSVRDGKRAIELATKACELTEYKEPHILSTLAAAYAETGDFDTAREVVAEGGRHERRGARRRSWRRSWPATRQNKPWRERQTLEERQPASDETTKRVEDRRRRRAEDDADVGAIAPTTAAGRRASRRIRATSRDAAAAPNAATRSVNRQSAAEQSAGDSDAAHAARRRDP